MSVKKFTQISKQDSDTDFINDNSKLSKHLDNLSAKIFIKRDFIDKANKAGINNTVHRWLSSKERSAKHLFVTYPRYMFFFLKNVPEFAKLIPLKLRHYYVISSPSLALQYIGDDLTADEFNFAAKASPGYALRCVRHRLTKTQFNHCLKTHEKECLKYRTRHLTKAKLLSLIEKYVHDDPKYVMIYCKQFLTEDQIKRFKLALEESSKKVVKKPVSKTTAKKNDQLTKQKCDYHTKKIHATKQKLDTRSDIIVDKIHKIIEETAKLSFYMLNLAKSKADQEVNKSKLKEKKLTINNLITAQLCVINEHIKGIDEDLKNMKLGSIM